jgi:hypothetical protein
VKSTSDTSIIFYADLLFVNPMISRIIPLLCVIALLPLITPAAATLALTDAVYIPDPPFRIGTPQHVTMTYFIGPSGATTFVPGHQLQMQTGLMNAQWNIQIRVDGLNNAQQSASGSAAFVNGALLSFSTNNDVTMEVTIDGVIPQTQDDQVIVLQVKEIDNTGNVVPGSILTLTQPVAGEPATTRQTVFPAPSSTRVPTSPTTSSGFPAILGIFAIGFEVIILFRGR